MKTQSGNETKNDGTKSRTTVCLTGINKDFGFDDILMSL